MVASVGRVRTTRNRNRPTVPATQPQPTYNRQNMTVYDLFFLVFAIGYLPYLVLKSKAHEDFGQRFGFLPEGLKRAGRERPIWIHAVSVGEVMTAKNLIKRLCEAHPEIKVVISTTTKTGQHIARKSLPEKVEKFYFPLDFSFTVRKALDVVRPSVVAIMETEIWPNLILELSKRKIPVCIINGRLSERSSKGYKRIKFIFKNILGKIDMFCMQSEADAGRIKEIGAPLERVHVTGNMKFDINPAAPSPSGFALKRQELGIELDALFLIAASTHKGEEKIILDSYSKLKKSFPGLELLIAPRHIDRSRDIANMIKEKGLGVSFVSELESGKKRKPGAGDILILDTIGELVKFFNLSDIVFMGGSLIKRGGHNLVEPAVFGKAILFGTHMFNFRRMRDVFLNEKAAVCVKDENELTETLSALLGDRSKRDALGNKARSLLDKNSGATEKNLNVLRKFYEN